MKITTKVTVHCCKTLHEFEHECAAMEFLLEHISKSHERLYGEIDRRARKLARSENGRGYWDTNDCDGWTNSSETFRQDWHIHALKDKLRK